MDSIPRITLCTIDFGIIVGGIMAYFMYYLRVERFPIPWTFIWRGVFYVLPEDDKNASMLKDMNGGNSKTKGYKVTRGGAFEEEIEVAYHNRYGDDALESVGYRDRMQSK
ncbi:hypothetical protein DID88_006796 [Monilinia fructigena]|uniref:Uncharacterized protein n=1 Tax=Monilinia fructigena TaxID=38457 RepID=A0A395IGH4_9HELO|nr:hypothetical protein DID88_006796 [Monilinia fructigena]